MVHADYNINSYQQKHMKQQQHYVALLCENFYCILVNYLCILFWYGAFWYHSYQQKLWNHNVLVNYLCILFWYDTIPTNKNYETTKQKLAALCENLYWLVNYMCILVWCVLIILFPPNIMKQIKPRTRTALLYCVRIICTVLWNNNCLLCGNSLANYLNLMSVWEFVV